jgi:hypothetical protein
MRLRTVVLAAATALAIAASALATSAATDPSKLVLQRKDFPAHSDFEASPGADGFNLRPALDAVKGLDAGLDGYVGATFSDKKGLLTVRGAVVTTASVAKAKQAFDASLKARQSFWKLLSAKYKPFSGAPSFGEQQLAFLKTPTPVTDGSIDIVVRKHATVWLLEVLVSDRQPPPSVSELVGDLKTYAGKQKSRIGAG